MDADVSADTGPPQRSTTRRLVSLTWPATEAGIDDDFGKMSTSEDLGHPGRGADVRASWRSCSHARAGDELAEAQRRH